MTLKVRYVSILALIGALAAPIAVTPAWAQVAPAVAASAASTQLAPDAKFIQNLGDRAISVIADKNLPPAQREAKYSQILHDAFDLRTTGHFVIGRAWDQATPEQQQEYMKLFEQLIVKIYGDRLNFYTGESFQVKSSRPENDKDSVVNSIVTHPDHSQPTSIDWRVRDKDGKPMVIDVIVEGVSQSVTQRQEYAAVIQRDNGHLDALLDLMRKQIQGGVPAAASSAGGQ